MASSASAEHPVDSYGFAVGSDIVAEQGLQGVEADFREVQYSQAEEVQGIDETSMAGPVVSQKGAVVVLLTLTA